MGLLGVTGVCALCALVGLVFVVIYAIQMNRNIKNVREISDKIRAINNKRPVPVEENKKPIDEDVAVYAKSVAEIREYFGHPLAPAVKAFFGAIRLRKSMWLPNGTNEGDEVVKRLLELYPDKELSTLSNAEFDKALEVLSAEYLIKKIGTLPAEDEKAKRINGLIGDGKVIDDPEKLIASAKLDKVLQASESAKTQAKAFKEAAAVLAASAAAPAPAEAPAAAGDANDSDDTAAATAAAPAAPAAPAAKPDKATAAAAELVKKIRAQVPDADKLDEAELAQRLAAVELTKKFKTLPANDAVAKNIRMLIPDADKLAEAELAKKIADVAALDRKLREIVKDSDPETLKKLREIKAEITPNKFLEALKKAMEGVDEKNFADRRTRFDDFIRDKFENWNDARDVFIAAAAPCIIEKLGSGNADEVLLAALGIPRNFSGESRALQQLIDNILEQLEERQITLYGRARGLGILSSGTNDRNGDVSEQDTDIQNLKQEDYPAIANHLDIVGYMLSRVGATKATIWDVQIRLKSAGGGVEGAERRFKDSKEQRDGFDIYHYTIEISGTMKQIRDAVRLLDDCYAVRRVYLVKNISLYAENNIADAIFGSKIADGDPEAAAAAEQQNPAPAAPTEGVRRRRQRSKTVVNPESADESDGSAKDREEQEKLDREYEEEQKKLPYYERDGWGERIVAAKEGAETYRAVIDIEYVVKPDK